MNFIIRKYTAKYKNGVIDLLKAVDKEFVPSITDRGFDSCLKEILDKNATLLLAFSGKEIVGALSFFVGTDYIHIDWLADHPNFRHHRIASILMEESIIKAKELKKIKVEIRTWSTNVKALHLYNELGFKVLNIKKNDRGKGIDTVELMLRLNN
jgi:ribosomal protein S18 acetylase RimI-like enzyme